MFSRGQKGFTLIELVLVMAVSGLLFVIAFAGQTQLRDRAQFDAAMNEIVATLADTRNQATAGVNLDGSGDGSTNVAGCPSVPLQTVFTGTSWTADNRLTGGPIGMEYWKTNVNGAVGSNACPFQFTTRPLPWGGMQIATNSRVLFVRNDLGGLTVCKVASTNNSNNDEGPSFKNRACSAPASQVAPGAPLKLFFSDGVGHSSEVDVDSSGLATRVN